MTLHERAQQLRGQHSQLRALPSLTQRHPRPGDGAGAGADDYVVKPFEPRELIARVRSILRRYPGQLELPVDPGQARRRIFVGWRCPRQQQ